MACPWDDLHNLGTEHLDDYGPGGLHPIIIGDTLGENGRFEVIHKLGAGGFATVWLCRDHLKGQWRAVKVLKACVSEDSNESRMMKFISRVPDHAREANHILIPSESFFVDGPNGRHACFVLPLMGKSLDEVFKDYPNQADVLRDICVQMVQAMSFLQKGGVCHGDFRPANILFKINIEGLHEMTKDELLSMFKTPRKVTIDRTLNTGEGLSDTDEGLPDTDEGLPDTDEGLPGTNEGLLDTDEGLLDTGDGIDPHLPEFVYTSESISVPPESRTTQIMLTDFGEAYYKEQPTGHHIGTPLVYAAPEVALRSHSSFPSEVWSLMATICEVRQGAPLVGNGDIVGYFQRVEDILGPLPNPYRTLWCEKGYQGNRHFPTAEEIPHDQPVSTSSKYLQVMRETRVKRSGYEDSLESYIRGKHGYGVRMQPGEIPQAPFERDMGCGFKRVDFQTSQEEADLLLDLVKKVFRYNPDERLTIGGVLEHPWISNFVQQRDVSIGASMVEDTTQEETMDKPASQGLTSCVSADEQTPPIVRVPEDKEDMVLGVQDPQAAVVPRHQETGAELSSQLWNFGRTLHRGFLKVMVPLVFRFLNFFRRA